MFSRIPSTVLFVLVTIFGSHVFGHTFLNNLIINGTDVANGKCIRPVTGGRTVFIGSTTDPNLRCRPGNQSPSATDICSVKAGSKIGVEWHHSSKTDSDKVISASHRGPCLIYMASMDKPIDSAAWFKVFEKGYSALKGSSQRTWCTDDIRANHGVLEFEIPSDIPSGNYLLRTEIIALHGAQREGYAQFYPNCAQINVIGGGNASPKLYKIPGIYKSDDPGIFVNIHNSRFTNYTIPGPPVYVPGSSGTTK